MFTVGSRYYTSPVSTVTDSRGTHQSVNYTYPDPRSIAFTFYQIEEGNTLDYIAFLAYGDATIWWKIADANPEILWWDQVPAGTIIRLPSAQSLS